MTPDDPPPAAPALPHAAATPRPLHAIAVLAFRVEAVTTTEASSFAID